MYKKMLIPLDGSKLAESVLLYAAELAGRLNLDMVFLRVCAMPAPGALSECTDYLARTAEAAEEAAREVQARAGAPGSQVEAQAIVTEGYPAEQIIKTARENDADLILMATHGYSGLRGWVMGSVADKVVRKSPVPVFLVRAGTPAPESYEAWLQKTVLVPLDGSAAAEAVLPHVEAMARQRGAENTDIRLLRVVETLWDTTDFPEAGIAVSWDNLEQARQHLRDEAEQYVGEIEARLRSSGLKASSEVRVCQAAAGIISCAAECPAGLIVMAARGLSGEGDWDIGSNASKVMHTVSCPVLMVRT